MKKICYYIVILLIPVVSISQESLSSKIQKYRKANEHKILKEFFELLSIPNVSSDIKNVRKNAEHIKKMMQNRGISSRLIETKGNPVVYGELIIPGAEQTLMFYVHYDGQPVDTSKWTETKPFKPIIRPGKLQAGTTEPKPIPFPSEDQEVNKNWRIYARSSSDDKTPIMAIFTAIDAIKKENIAIKNNIKFIFEGEEEAGSIHLRSFCEENKHLLKSDILFICDGPVYFSGDPSLYFGVRGITSIEITIYGPNTSLHSGHYGNWAPNPALRLAKLLSSMKDEKGNVIIKGFYENIVPLSDREKEALYAIPPYDDMLKKQLGFSSTEGAGKNLMELIQFPSLNIRGLQSGWVGRQARTIIPSTATASIDIRLVKGNDPQDMINKVKRHIKEKGYFIVSEEPSNDIRMKYPMIVKIRDREGGYRASRTSMDLPISKRVIQAISNHSNRDPILLPTLGGSVPIYIFADILNVPIIGIPIVNHDNNQHQPDENLRIGHLWTGIETMSAVIMMNN